MSSCTSSINDWCPMPLTRDYSNNFPNFLTTDPPLEGERRVYHWDPTDYQFGDPECGICGGFPARTGCYHICPNSVHYYSPEQERMDDAHYGDDYMQEAYGDTAECYDYADAMEHGYGGGDPDDGWH